MNAIDEQLETLANQMTKDKEIFDLMSKLRNAEKEGHEILLNGEPRRCKTEGLRYSSVRKGDYEIKKKPNDILLVGKNRYERIEEATGRSFIEAANAAIPFSPPVNYFEEMDEQGC